MYYDPYRPDEQTPPSGYQTEPVSKKKKKGGLARTIALCLVCSLIGGAAGAGGAVLFAPSQQPYSSTTLVEGQREPTAVNIVHTETNRQLSLEEIYASWVNSTVGITTQVTTNVYGQQVSGATAGSGFVISSDGYILTNYHVISNASTVKVAFYDGTEYDATVIGGEKTNDVAVLKINAEGLTPVILGDSDELHVGETVTAIGNPLGELTFTQTAGIVSALDRMISMSDGTKVNMIQTDCSINSGNSGGPLFNTYGEVVGITSAKYSNNGSYSEASIEGIGFAIPINDVADMVKDIIEYGYVTNKPYMGVSVATVYETDAQRYGWVVGAYVNIVEENGPAAQAGLRRGDIITAMGDEPVTNQGDLIVLKNTYKAGDTTELTVFRAGEEIVIPFTFGEAPPNSFTHQEEAQPTQQPQWPDSFYWPFGGFGW